MHFARSGEAICAKIRETPQSVDLSSYLSVTGRREPLAQTVLTLIFILLSPESGFEDPEMDRAGACINRVVLPPLIWNRQYHFGGSRAISWVAHGQSYVVAINHQREQVPRLSSARPHSCLKPGQGLGGCYPATTSS